MDTTFPDKQDNWILPVRPATASSSTVPNFEVYGPLRVNREGVRNYMKHRGTLNIGNWAIEGRRTSSVFAQPGVEPRNAFIAPPPKVLGSEAMRNYKRSVSSTPNLLGGVVNGPHPHHNMRVKREGQANYNKAHNTQMKPLLESYGKLSVLPQPAPHTNGKMATDLFYFHQKGHLDKNFTNYGHFPLSPRPPPHVNGAAAEKNLQKAQGSSIMLEHRADFRAPSTEPHVLGVQAQRNYDVARSGHLDKLFHDYGKQPLSARPEPKVTYGGVENFVRAQGDAVRKIITQCPPSHRYLERPQSVPVWR